MSTILHITASIRDQDDSISRRLSGILVDGLRAKTGATVIERDLAADQPPHIDAARFAANLTPPADRSDEQASLAALADSLISELEDADTIVFGVPIYNFAMPSTLKAWADMVARAGTTFKYTESGAVGQLSGKKAYIAVASGGTTMGSAIDFMTPWLKHFLGFLGITDIETVAADGIMGAGGEEKIAAAAEQARKMVA